MKKTYVLDTNVLLTDPESIFKFEDNDVILPITVIEECDKFKGEQNELGRNARQVARNLDKLRQLGKLDVGVRVDNGGTLKVALTLSQTILRLPFDLDENVPDNRILSVAIDSNGILVTNDVNLRIKAEALGIKAEEYKHDNVQLDNFYTGTDVVYVKSEIIDNFYKNKVLSLMDLELKLYPTHNQYFTFIDFYNEKHSALGRYNSSLQEFKLLEDISIMNMVPKNKEQQFSLDALLDPSIPLVSLTGPAGTSKSFSAILAGLYQVLETKQYSKMMILKPIISLDNANKLGYRKGTFMEKIAPWIASYADNIEIIMGEPKVRDTKKSKKKNEFEEKDAGRTSMMEELISFGLLEVGDLETMRGRSLPNMYIILDETQSCSKHLLKSVITRLAEGSKIVIAGDLEQIDLPWISAESSGLTYVIEKFKGDNLFAHIHLTKSVRSAIAERAAELL
jgi:PhoH-like ATPase